MARVRRYFRVMPPGAFEYEMREVASELPIDDLVEGLAVIQAEIDQRQGREKYQIPAHVLRMLN